MGEPAGSERSAPETGRPAPVGTRRPRWLGPALLAATLVVQLLVLRAVWNPSPHPGGDNAGYVALAHALATGQGYTESWDPAASPHTKYPPGWPAALAVAQRAGADTWVALKRVAGLLALAAVAATWLYVARRRDAWWATGVALSTGASYAVVYHAPLLLSDVPFLAFVVLAMWAGERALEERAPPAPEEGVSTRPPSTGLPWAVAAAILAALALLTRTAGLPVAAALVGALAWGRRFREAAVAALLTGVPAGWWILRGRGVVQEGAYAREFWLVDPYRPELGEIGLGGLAGRAATNLQGYLLEWLPRTFAGPEVGVAGLLVLALAVAAVAGWVLAVRRRVGPAELFAPLYAGVILVWPPVWSGDRFALPLVPFIVVWAGEAILALSRRFLPDGVRARAGALPVALAGVLLAVPVADGVVLASGEAAACRGAARVGGPWACAGLGMVQFTEAARWAGANLPGDAVVLTRKPRIWYIMSGIPTRTYPFSAESDSLLAAADRTGARYVLLDLVSGQAELVARAIGGRPGAFCSVAGFGGRDGGPRTELLGILPPASRGAAPGEGGATVSIGACPPAMEGRRGEPLDPYSASSPIPLLAPPAGSSSP